MTSIGVVALIITYVDVRLKRRRIAGGSMIEIAKGSIQ